MIPTLALTLALLAPEPPLLNGLDDYFVTPTKAYAIKPAEPIASGRFARLQWSPKGRYLMAVYERDPLTFKIGEKGPTAVMVVTPKGRVLHNLQLPPELEYQWVDDNGDVWGGNAAGFGKVIDGPERFISHPLDHGGAGFVDNGAFAAPNGNSVTLFYAGGRSETLTFGERVSVFDGRLVHFSVEGMRRYDFAKKSWLPIRGDISLYPSPEKNRVEGLLSAQKEDKNSYDDVDTETVIADMEIGEISPNRDMVAYVSRGALVVRRLVAVDRDAAIRTRDAVEKERLMHAANAFAKAFPIIVNDLEGSDDPKIPPWHGFLDMYAFDVPREMPKRFIPTFTGKSLSEIPNPKSFVVGYLPGRSGRANVYADGHAEWAPKKP